MSGRMLWSDVEHHVGGREICSTTPLVRPEAGSTSAHTDDALLMSELLLRLGHGVHRGTQGAGTLTGMDPLFAPPKEPWQRVSPKLATMRILEAAVLAVLAATAAIVLAWLTAVPGWVGSVGLVAAVLGGALGSVLLVRNARSWGYAERAEDIYVTRGLLFRRLAVVPYGRMQFVDVTAGPVARLFGVAEVHLHTANPDTNLRIPGLVHDEAIRLRDRLTALGESSAAGL
jgi:membrane protein YdbS with pleckstrin-like domain